MITTVVANLVRYGVREPRIGALFLSGLGLAVVAFLVLVTTRRSVFGPRSPLDPDQIARVSRVVTNR